MVQKPPKIIIEWILSAWNNISCEAIGKSFKSCALTTALDGDENDQAEILIDEDEEGDECIIMMSGLDKSMYVRTYVHGN